MSSFVVTGAAGFIGFHLSQRLLHDGHAVVGVDNLRPMYGSGLSRERLALLTQHPRFTFHEADVVDSRAVDQVFAAVADVAAVVHLAALAGVRASIERPLDYARTNVVGTTSILDAAARRQVPHVVYASSSSVYGGNVDYPYRASDPTDHPVSPYAATKRSTELLAHSYAHVQGVPVTGVRFFTVYGPWGRPDMAYWKFARAILDGDPLQVYGDGSAIRDFTHIDDVVEGLVRLLDCPPEPTTDRKQFDSSRSWAPYRVLNLGQGGQATVQALIELLADEFEVTPRVEFTDKRAGDVDRTWSDSEPLAILTGFRPTVEFDVGMRDFARWFRQWAR